MSEGEKVKKFPDFSKLLREASETLPHNEWICPDCKSKNTNWFPDFIHIQKYKEIKFNKGICDTCNKIKTKKLLDEKKRCEEEEIKKNIQTLIIHSRIPPRVIQSTFETLEIKPGAEKAFDTMKRIGNADRWIYISGDNDTGKTLLAGATINNLSKQLIPSYYFDERSLFRRLRDTIKNSEETSKSIFNNFWKAKVIIWDDAFILPYTDWEFGTAFDILQLCENYRKVIIFISNMNLKRDLKLNKKDVENNIGKRQIRRIMRDKNISGVYKPIFFIEMKNEPFK